MSRCTETRAPETRVRRLLGACAVAAGVLAAATAFAQAKYPGVGRAATPAEVAAWDIDVRADFQGLPRGSGSVKKGEAVWIAKCASCHGDFAEANHTFPPLAGGTTAEDIKRGRVASLTQSEEQRTTLMKLSKLSSLWDYINRAMPWNAAKTLTVEEVYAVTAYILNLGEIVPEDFVLSDANIAQVQKRLPNRDGLKFFPDLWNVRGKGDVRNPPCMKNCPTEHRIASELPDFARGSHGSLAEQNRAIGAVRGAGAPLGAIAAAAPGARAQPGAGPADLAKKFACLACHGVATKVVGPSLREIGQKYKGVAGAEANLLAKLKVGGAGVWGSVPMPPQGNVSDTTLRTLVQWILAGSPQN